ncbi:uncharacterized protein LOC6578761 [Drosophila mojavensis]|uniref:Uncharacterized protein n=1 Tax=Drosophila mojavensis TaxID=7230 RepID=B4KU27_DROMO|nr:uncharacterized protein LOC6578761 [Drosophila mojavensis]EDW08604.2 uncharacterized protein Dmoj_GI20056 [Drosophila mojavensis]
MNKIVSYWYKGDACQAAGVISPEESEILSSSDFDDETVSAEEPDLNLPYQQLEAIKQRLKKMRAKLIYTPPDPCEQEDDGVSAGEQADFLNQKQLQLQQLRRSNCLLRCQLQSRVQHLHRARKELLLVENMRCQLNKMLEKMVTEMNILEEFKVSVQHHFGLCIERNEQIKMSKIDCHDFSELVHDKTIRRMGHMRPLVPLRCHLQVRYNLNVELILLRVFLQSLFGNITEDWKLFNRILKKSCRKKHKCSNQKESNKLLALGN